MVKAFIQMLIARRVAYLIAPYEADSEMAYLCRTGIVDAVISEDSDTICYRCPRVLTKMDVSGHCLSITLEDVFSSKEIGIQTWNCDQLELMCVLSGCDYLKSLPQIGLKTAKKYVDRGRSLESTLREIAKVPKHFPKDSPVTLSMYRVQLQEAIACFHHQVVFDPLENRSKYLTSLTPAIRSRFCEKDGCSFGSVQEPEKAKQLARGYLNAKTGEPYLAASQDTEYLDVFFQSRRPQPVVSSLSVAIDVHQPLCVEKESESGCVASNGGPKAASRISSNSISVSSNSTTNPSNTILKPIKESSPSPQSPPKVVRSKYLQTATPPKPAPPKPRMLFGALPVQSRDSAKVASFLDQFKFNPASQKREGTPLQTKNAKELCESSPTDVLFDTTPNSFVCSNNHSQTDHSSDSYPIAPKSISSSSSPSQSAYDAAPPSYP